MSNARQCDRCKRCFNPYQAPSGQLMARFSNPILQTSQQMKELKIGRYLIEDEVSKDVFVDLCPECTENFLMFMENVPTPVTPDQLDAPDIYKKINRVDIMKNLNKVNEKLYEIFENKTP